LMDCADAAPEVRAASTATAHDVMMRDVIVTRMPPV
jgi:hypothetical protein